MSPIFRGFLAYQAGGIVVLAALHFIAVPSNTPHPLRPSLTLWAGYALIFAGISLFELVRPGRR
jgi:hypothetical protein